MDNPLATLRVLVLAVLLAPLGAAAVCGLLGAAGRNPRRFALLFALAHVGLTAAATALAVPDLLQRGATADAFRADAGFRPAAVPGDPGVRGDPESQTYQTTWGVLTLAPAADGVPPADVQFFVGLDGLNVWLVALTSLTTLVAVLVSWDAIADRPAGFYAWLFVLQTGVLGAFLAFDVVLFYVFFELTLIPAFFLIGSWGVGGGRRDAARKFFLYTLFGSLLTLVGAVGVVLTNPTPLHPASSRALVGHAPLVENGLTQLPKRGPVTFSIPALMRNVGTWAEVYEARARETAARGDEAAAADAKADRDNYRLVQTWLFVALMAGFAVKVPVVPFHTWLPAAYGEAPTGVTMILSALLAKLGTFGILRLVLPLTPDAAVTYGLPVFGTLGAVGIVYAALCAYAQRDVKQLAAYSSVSHLGFLVVALFAFNPEGLTGGTLHMVNHGLSVGALFGLLGFLARRYRTLDSNQYGGLWARYPGYTLLMFVVCLAGIGLPGLNNFASEMLMLAGLFRPEVTRAAGYGLAVTAAVGILLSAWYVLTMLRRVFFGPLREPPAVEPAGGLTGREAVAFGLPAVLCLVLGVFPQPVIDTIKADAGVVAGIGAQARLRAGPPPATP